MKAIRPLFAVKRQLSSAPKSFLDFNNALLTEVGSVAGLESLGEHAKLLTDQLDQVRLLFGLTERLTAERIVPRIKSIMSNGQFESRLASDPNGERSMFLENSVHGRVELAHAILQDLVKGSKVFLREVCL